MSGTVVGALLRQLGISVEQLSKDPELEIFLPLGRLWVSKVVTPNLIGRIMCVEIPLGGSGADQIVQQAFRSLPMLEARGLPLNSICLPVLGTGLARLNVEDLLRPILDGAQWALRILKSLDRVKLVRMRDQQMAKYFIYENWTHDRARVHKGECGYCNDGRGTQAGSSPRNGKWHGPLERDDAFRLATRLRRADTKACPNCAP